MTAVRTWLLGVILTSFACAVARNLVPSGREQRFLRLTSGLLVLLSAVQPLARVGEMLPAFAPLDLSEQIQSQKDSMEQEKERELSSLIAERTAAYIWDKASQLGVEVTVSVELTISEGGLPIPNVVTLMGSYSEELSAWLEREMGIDVHQQIWLEGIE